MSGEFQSLRDQFFSYRIKEEWEGMINLAETMPSPLREDIVVQEQLAMALNRAGRGEEAEKMLMALVGEQRGTSKTYGILGRVYKDRWAKTADDTWLHKAIEAYESGFRTDPRDFYPGINFLTLREIQQQNSWSTAPAGEVISAVEMCITKGKRDYWVYATLLEWAILGKNAQDAMSALYEARTQVSESWEPKTTLNNLRLLREVRERREEVLPWMREVEAILAQGKLYS
jgi:hypothetical protein